MEYAEKDPVLAIVARKAEGCDTERGDVWIDFVIYSTRLAVAAHQ